MGEINFDNLGQGIFQCTCTHFYLNPFLGFGLGHISCKDTNVLTLKFHNERCTDKSFISK
jgi:hypothetical protein